MGRKSLTFLGDLKKVVPRGASTSCEGSSGVFSINLSLEYGGHKEAVATHELGIRGPGDVPDTPAELIARKWPKPNTCNADSSLFAFIEFKDPTWPWRYSVVDMSRETAQFRPWLSLVVLTEPEIREMQEEGIEVIQHLENGRTVVNVKAKYLPDLELAWATAHAQLTDYDADVDGDVFSFISANPDRHCSRLMSLRRLTPETKHTVFLTSNYRASSNAALGLSNEGVGDQDAWAKDEPEKVFRLVVYEQPFSFSTATVGNFEYLARRLMPYSMDDSLIGFRAVDANLMSSSFEVNTDLYVKREGALAAPGFSAERAGYLEANEKLPLSEPIRNLMNESLKAAGDIEGDDNSELDPLVTFPVYGCYFRKTDEILCPDETGNWPSGSPWIHELNLDFRNRIAAGLGAEVVRSNRDEYLEECWRQVGKILEANELIRKTKSAFMVARAIERKHIATLPPDRFTLFTIPFHGHFAHRDEGRSVSLKGILDSSGISKGSFTTTFKRIAHNKIGIANVRIFDAWERSKCSCFPRKRSPKEPPKIEIPKILIGLIDQIPGRDEPVLPPRPPAIPVRFIDIESDFRPKFDIHKVLLKKINSRIRLNDGRKISMNFDQIMASPKIQEPMYKKLAADYVLPGIENLKDNGVTIAEENTRFIASHAVGKNHFMGQALLMDDFPTDQRGTIFSYFWDPVTQFDPVPDIEEIHRWQNDLGRNRPAGRSGPNLILVIKGDIVLKYADMIVYALRIVDRTDPSQPSYWSEVYKDDNPSIDTDLFIEPVFRAQISEDILFVGFPFSLENVRGVNKDAEYYVILQENCNLARFGADEETGYVQDLCGDATDRGRNDLNWANLELDSIRFICNTQQNIGCIGPNAAEVAYNTYQVPFRVAIHISHLLPDEANQ